MFIYLFVIAFPGTQYINNEEHAVLLKYLLFNSERWAGMHSCDRLQKEINFGSIMNSGERMFRFALYSPPTNSNYMPYLYVCL
jgi:hypothetical protein